MKKWLVSLAALLGALAGPTLAQQPAIPPSQAAFRAALTKHQEASDVEKEFAGFQTLERSRATVLADILGDGLMFRNWVLELKGIEPTPRGGYFVRFVDPALADMRQVRPTFWNGGPGRIGRETAIYAATELHETLRGMRPGSQAVVSGRFYRDDNGGPLFEASKTSFRANEAEKAKFRMPYFSVQFTSIQPK